MREGWEYKKLKEIGQTQTGTTPSKSVKSYYGGEIPFIRPAELDIDGNGSIEYNSELKLTPEGALKSRMISANSILMCCIGSVGKTGYSIKDVTCNQQINTITPYEGYNSKFVYYALLTPSFQNEVIKIANSAKVTLAIISKGKWEEMSIPVPSLSTQESIVSELDKINELISLKKEQLKDYDNLAQSIFYDMFGDPVTNEKGWEVKKLKDIVADDCSISYGIVQPGDGVDNGVPVVRPVDMTHTFVKRSGLKQTTKEISDSYKRTILKGNEILMCVRGTTGLVALATEDIKDCNVTRGVTPIECNADNSRLYIYHLLLTAGIQQYIANYTKGIALKQINMQDVREIPLMIPPLSLQQAFAKRIEAIEKQKQLISSEIKDLETLLASRMQYWFD